jgi:hypothetical protein
MLGFEILHTHNSSLLRGINSRTSCRMLRFLHFFSDGTWEMFPFHKRVCVLARFPCIANPHLLFTSIFLGTQINWQFESKLSYIHKYTNKIYFLLCRSIFFSDTQQFFYFCSENKNSFKKNKYIVQKVILGTHNAFAGRAKAIIHTNRNTIQ